VVQAGLIETYSNDEIRNSFYPKLCAGGFFFDCTTKVALVCVYTCKVKNFNGWDSKIILGRIAHTSRTWLPLAAVGDFLCADLYFSTTDSHGGRCYWRTSEDTHY